MYDGSDKMTNYTYILQCEDGTYYTGWTNDLKKRFQAHMQGKGAKYTKSHRPVKVAYYEVFDTPQEAMSREWHIKKLNREEKIELIRNFKDDQGLETEDKNEISEDR